MAMLGLGTDIAEVTCIGATIARSDERLARRILSDNKWAIWKAHRRPVRFLTKRFAMKEVTAEVLGTGIRSGLAFNQSEVFDDKLSKSRLRLRGEALRPAEKLDAVNMYVTLVDERHCTCATVIIGS